MRFKLIAKCVLSIFAVGYQGVAQCQAALDLTLPQLACTKSAGQVGPTCKDDASNLTSSLSPDKSMKHNGDSSASFPWQSYERPPSDIDTNRLKNFDIQNSLDRPSLDKNGMYWCRLDSGTRVIPCSFEDWQRNQHDLRREKDYYSGYKEWIEKQRSLHKK